MVSEKVDFLATVSLFSHLKEEELERLADQSRYCSFNFGDVIIREGERDDRLYILVSGKVNVFKSYRTQKEKRLRTLEPPAYFGEMALIDDLVRSATVVALRDTKTLCLDKLDLDREIERSAIIYNQTVRHQIDQLRDGDQRKLEALAQELSAKRLQWFNENRQTFKSHSEDVVEYAYQIFLKKLGITADEAPVTQHDNRTLVLHSQNFCPTLEACRILALDTRFVCRHLTEKPTTDLLRQIHPKLRFTRNYEKLRPYTPYCEEMIILDEY